MPKTMPDPEEFAAWRDHPVTQWVAQAYGKMAEIQRQAWVEATWDAGEHLPEAALVELRTRADAYRSMAECDYSDLVSIHEPEAEDAQV